MSRECPSCGESITRYAKSCDCGWREGVSTNKGPDMRECGRCGETLMYPKFREQKPEGNYISGPGYRGGHVCKKCYESGEPHHLNALNDWLAEHPGMWKSLFVASGALESKEDKIDMLALLKKQLGKGLLPLPYNPGATAEEIEAGTDEFENNRTEELKARARAAVEKYLDSKRAA